MKSAITFTRDSSTPGADTFRNAAGSLNRTRPSAARTRPTARPPPADRVTDHQDPCPGRDGTADGRPTVRAKTTPENVLDFFDLDSAAIKGTVDTLRTDGPAAG